MSPHPATEIAIVGIAAELPSGSWADTNLDHRSFFRFLLERGEAYERIPLERFNIKSLVGNGIGQCTTDTGTFLKNAHHFDPLEFGVTSKDAHMMPLSTRRLIETAFLSLVDSGIDYRGRNVGCYASGVSFDMFSISGHDDYEARGSFASCPSMVANRVSYYLDLRGPSIPIDTACSSSLSATHVAVQAILHGECEAAVVGGAQINHRFAEWLQYSRGSLLSPDGKSKPFDASANGFSRGEGVVCMVLKPLDAALRDGDKVYAAILGTGINNCGSLAPVNAPVASSQREAMQRAFAQAGRDPRQVDYLELHTTGTAAGDPTEANWVGQEFSRDGELVLGSVKGNIGHLEISAFLASLCKVCSIFETGIIPPNVNLKTPNPAIKWKEYRLRVPVEQEELVVRAPSGRPLVAMTSSGVGGTNAHCVVEGPPPASLKPSAIWSAGCEVPLLLIAGGLSPRSTVALSEDLREKLPSWASEDVKQAVARALGRRGRSMTWRSFAVKDGEVLTKFSEPVLATRASPSVVFVFSGQGPQHYAMGRELFKSCAVFRKSIMQLDKIYQSVVGQSLLEVTGLFEGARASDPFGEIWPIAVTIVSLTMLQIALFDTLVALGIKPDVVIGHSAGETPLVYASGSGSRALAMELAIARGKAMSLLETEAGTMAAFSCPPERAAEVIAEVVAELGPGTLEVGCFNAPGAVTLSGHADYVHAAVKKASDAGIFARRLRTRIPVHSAMMDICREEYQRLVGDVFSRYHIDQPTVETWSTKTGTLLGSPYDAQYYWDSTRGPVNFTDALQGVAKTHPHAIYVELGPHPVLTSYISSMAGKNAVVTCPLRRAKAAEKRPVEVAGLLETVGKLFVAGYTQLDFDALYGTSPAPPDALPPFPFARKDIPYTSPTAEIARQRQHRNGPLNYPQLQLNDKTHPDLAEHVIKNEPIVSTAAFLEMALEFGARKLYNVELVSMLSLSAKRPTHVDVQLEGTRWRVSSAAPIDYTKTWPIKYNRLHVKGHLSMQLESEDIRPAQNIAEISGRMESVDMTGFYDGYNSFAQYGSTYQRIVACSYVKDYETGNDEWLVKLRGADTDLPGIGDYRIHPAILDASLHFLVHPVVTGINDSSRYYLPSSIGGLVVYDALLDRPFPSTVYAHATFKAWTPETLLYDILVMGEDGTPLYSVEELVLSLHGNSVPPVKSRYELVYAKTEHFVVRPEDGGAVPHVTRKTPSPGMLWPVTDSSDSGYASSPSEDASSTILSPLKRRGDSTKTTHVLRYDHAAGTSIQGVVQDFGGLPDVSLWFYASAGADGDALVGFARTLRQEPHPWSVCGVVFDSTWSQEDALQITESLSQRFQLEEDVFIEADGSISVPRIVEAPAPPLHTTFQPSLPWKYDKASLTQISAPYAPQDHVVVHVTAAAMAPEQLWSFVGRTQPSDKSLLVAGIASGPLTNFAVAHKFALVELPDTLDKDAISSLLPAVIAALAVGVAAFSRPEYLRRQTIVITHSDTTLGTHVAKLYCMLGANVVSLPSCYTVSELKAALARRPHVIVSGSQDKSETKTFGEAVYPHGRVFLWNDPENGVGHILRNDPCSVSAAARAVVPYLPTLSEPGLLRPPLELIAPVIPGPVSSMAEILDPTKSYLLFDGISSLGLRLAYWMYKKGARELLLTSHSEGHAGLLQAGDYTALRLLAYLEALPDLRLHVACVEDSPLEMSKRAIDGLGLPMGGCLILSGVLPNRSAVVHTSDTVDLSLTTVVDVFKMVEESLPVESLDFLVTFLSASGIFGSSWRTNYGSANMSVTALSKEYRNAVCIVSPAVLDVSAVRLSKRNSDWGMTSIEFFAYVEDAVRCVKSRLMSQYVPAFDWALVKANMGPSALYEDLVPVQSADVVEASVFDGASSLKEVVCGVLDIAPEDLSSDVPFTSYGLDSLSAAALSHALRPFLAISQLQLLADINLRELEARLEA
ncbi:ketoacyl-synt-domain-containing protein [Pilatotrama ljubarskyi]|nr:ketoacyl-synt-domain-containing protein [Pilatotrama ljubarskyi]